MTDTHADIVEGWADWLQGVKWDWFATLTFRELVTGHELADKAYRVWRSKLNRHFAGARWHTKDDRKYPYVVRAAELQKRGAIHYHCLIGHASDELMLNETRRRFRDVWYRDMRQGIADIQRIYSVDRVTNYVAKYVGKGGDLDASPNFPQPHKETTPFDWSPRSRTVAPDDALSNERFYIAEGISAVKTAESLL